MSQVNYILAFYTVIIIVAFVIPSRYLSDDLDVAWRALVIGLLLLFGITLLGLVGYPGLVMSTDKLLLAPALFTVFVVKNPDTFLAIETGCIITVYFAMSIKKELD